MEVDQSDITIAASALKCYDSFDKCLAHAAKLLPRELSLVEDQVGRFSIWAANMGVFAPGRASMDYRLSEAPEVRQLVLGLLETSNDCITDCMMRINSLKGLELEDSQDGKQPRREELEQAARAVATEITLLHQLSNTIRKASRETQNMKAATFFDMKDYDGKDLGSEFRDHFAVELLRRKFPTATEDIRNRLASAMLLRRKRILYRRSRYIKNPIRTSSSVPQSKQHSGPLQPLGASGAFPQATDQSQGSQVASSKKSAFSLVASQARTATVVDPNQFRKVASPSVISGPKTVALGDHEDLSFPPAPQGYIVQRFSQIKEKRLASHEAELASLPNYRLYREYNRHPPLAAEDIWELERKISAADENLKLSLEEDWKLAHEADVDVMCPYCCCVLPSVDLRDERKWRQHVLSDLDAYVCLFEDCHNPDELYNNSTSWLKHMRDHTLKWRCLARSHKKPEVFETQAEYEKHMQDCHKGSFKESQLPLLAERSARSIGVIFSECPLCGVSEVSGRLEDHIVGHLRFLALKSLPFIEDEAENGLARESTASVSARPQKRSTIENDSDLGNVPTFDDPGDHSDAPLSEASRVEAPLTDDTAEYPEGHYAVFMGMRQHERGFSMPDSLNFTTETDPILESLAANIEIEQYQDSMPLTTDLPSEESLDSVNPRALPMLTYYTRNAVELTEALTSKQHRSWIIKLDQEFRHFVKDRKQRQRSIDCHILDRELALELARNFQLIATIEPKTKPFKIFHVRKTNQTGNALFFYRDPNDLSPGSAAGMYLSLADIAERMASDHASNSFDEKIGDSFNSPPRDENDQAAEARQKMDEEMRRLEREAEEAEEARVRKTIEPHHRAILREDMRRLVRKAKEAEETEEAEEARTKRAYENAEKAIKEAEERLKPTDEDKSKPSIEFEDAAGRMFSFPWYICKTWKGMDGLIKQVFMHIDVLRPRIQVGNYDLVGPGGEIIPPQLWEMTVQPGWRITMYVWRRHGARVLPPLPLPDSDSSGELDSPQEESAEQSSAREEQAPTHPTGGTVQGIPRTNLTNLYYRPTVTAHGFLLGGREYRCQTFSVPGRGDDLFMLNYECASVLGYRDSFSMLKQNPSISKDVISEGEKDYLIAKGILPSLFRPRTISIVPAKSMFRHFGSRLIVDGEPVFDDYREADVQNQGFTEENSARQTTMTSTARMADAARQAASINSNIATVEAMTLDRMFNTHSLGPEGSGDDDTDHLQENSLPRPSWVEKQKGEPQGGGGKIKIMDPSRRHLAEGATAGITAAELVRRHRATRAGSLDSHVRSKSSDAAGDRIEPEAARQPQFGDGSGLGIFNDNFNDTPAWTDPKKLSDEAFARPAFSKMPRFGQQHASQGDGGILENLPGTSGSSPKQSAPEEQRTVVMPDRMRWFYRDPQGNVQGPFSGLQMHDWYKAGFFSPGLPVRRQEDWDYEMLAQYIKRIGNSREPFLVPQRGIHYPPTTTQSSNQQGAQGFQSLATLDTLDAVEQRNLEQQKIDESMSAAAARERELDRALNRAAARERELDRALNRAAVRMGRELASAEAFARRKPKWERELEQELQRRDIKPPHPSSASRKKRQQSIKIDQVPPSQEHTDGTASAQPEVERIDARERLRMRDRQRW